MADPFIDAVLGRVPDQPTTADVLARMQKWGPLPWGTEWMRHQSPPDPGSLADRWQNQIAPALRSALMGLRASPSAMAPPSVKQWSPDFIGPHGAADPWSRNPGIAPSPRSQTEVSQPDPPSFYEMWAKQGEAAKAQPAARQQDDGYSTLREYYNLQNPAYQMAKSIREVHGPDSLQFAQQMAEREPFVAQHLPAIEKFLLGNDR